MISLWKLSMICSIKLIPLHNQEKQTSNNFRSLWPICFKKFMIQIGWTGMKIYKWPFSKSALSIYSLSKSQIILRKSYQELYLVANRKRRRTNIFSDMNQSLIKSKKNNIKNKEMSNGKNRRNVISKPVNNRKSIVSNSRNIK